MKLRNVSEHALELRPVGRTVEPDEVVDVADDLFHTHAWPESLWSVVSPSRKHKDEE